MARACSLYRSEAPGHIDTYFCLGFRPDSLRNFVPWKVHPNVGALCRSTPAFRSLPQLCGRQNAERGSETIVKIKGSSQLTQKFTTYGPGCHIALQREEQPGGSQVAGQLRSGLVHAGTNWPGRLLSGPTTPLLALPQGVADEFENCE